MCVCVCAFMHKPRVEGLVTLGLMGNFAVHGMTQLSEPSLRPLKLKALAFLNPINSPKPSTPTNPLAPSIPPKP